MLTRGREADDKQRSIPSPLLARPRRVRPALFLHAAALHRREAGVASAEGRHVPLSGRLDYVRLAAFIACLYSALL